MADLTSGVSDFGVRWLSHRFYALSKSTELSSLSGA